MKLPVISGRDLLKFLQSLGYEVVRIRGSHARLKKKTEYGEQAITVPLHKEIAKGTLNDILNAVSRWNDIPKRKLIEMLED